MLLLLLFSIYCNGRSLMRVGHDETTSIIDECVIHCTHFVLFSDLDSKVQNSQNSRMLQSYLQRHDANKTYDFSSSSFRMLTLLREPGTLSPPCSFWLKVLLLYVSSKFILGQEPHMCVVRFCLERCTESLCHSWCWVSFSFDLVDHFFSAVLFYHKVEVICFKNSWI
jgi:hypothetical protein